MLPKPEKVSKKSSTEQLDFVETIDDVDKTKKKRISIVVFLFLTVGLSLFFVIYRQLQNYNFEQLKISAPSFKLPSLVKSNFSPTLPSDWSLFVQTVGSTNFTYSSNYLSSDFTKIKVLHHPSYAKKYLPDGVVISEKTNTTADYLEIFSQISTPKVKFEIYCKIPGTINSNSPEIETYSRLVETFYWHILNL
jgi:hypothetical protein